MWAKLSDGSEDAPPGLSTGSLTLMGALKGVALATNKANGTSGINNHNVEEITRL